jgi:hypothetical protein
MLEAVRDALRGLGVQFLGFHEAMHFTLGLPQASDSIREFAVQLEIASGAELRRREDAFTAGRAGGGAFARRWRIGRAGEDRTTDEPDRMADDGHETDEANASEERRQVRHRGTSSEGPPLNRHRCRDSIPARWVAVAPLSMRIPRQNRSGCFAYSLKFGRRRGR